MTSFKSLGIANALNNRNSLILAHVNLFYLEITVARKKNCSFVSQFT